jgi:hypothetical protein
MLDGSLAIAVVGIIPAAISMATAAAAKARRIKA